MAVGTVAPHNTFIHGKRAVRYHALGRWAVGLRRSWQSL